MGITCGYLRILITKQTRIAIINEFTRIYKIFKGIIKHTQRKELLKDQQTHPTLQHLCQQDHLKIRKPRYLNYDNLRQELKASKRYINSQVFQITRNRNYNTIQVKRKVYAKYKYLYWTFQQQLNYIHQTVLKLKDMLYPLLLQKNIELNINLFSIFILPTTKCIHQYLAIQRLISTQIHLPQLKLWEVIIKKYLRNRLKKQRIKQIVIRDTTRIDSIYLEQNKQIQEITSNLRIHNTLYEKYASNTINQEPITPAQIASNITEVISEYQKIVNRKKIKMVLKYLLKDLNRIKCD